MTTCESCVFRKSVRGHGQCWEQCSHNGHNQKPYQNILWGCQEKFTRVPGWCPLKAGGCDNCENRGKIDGLSQQTFCDSCVHHGNKSKKDHFKPKMVMPHTPKGHKRHTSGVPCGCWTGTGNGIACEYCGATYELAEVVEFPEGIWRCYDCGASVFWSSAKKITLQRET